MSDYERCPKCRRYGWLDSHKCPALFLVWDEGYEGDEEHATEVYGTDVYDAVESYATDRTYGDVEGLFETPVWARLKDGDEPAKKYDIAGECVPSFMVTEAKT